MFMRACCYSHNRPFLFIYPNTPYQRIIKEKRFVQRYYGKSIFLLLLLLLLLLHIHKYLSGLFLKAYFSSLDAVFTCTFLGTFCLKPHLRRIQGICEYSDILYRFSLLSSLQPACCGPTLIAFF